MEDFRRRLFLSTSDVLVADQNYIGQAHFVAVTARECLGAGMW